MRPYESRQLEQIANRKDRGDISQIAPKLVWEHNASTMVATRRDSTL